MIDLFKKGINLGLGLAYASKDQVEKMVDELVQRGEVSKEDSKSMLQQLMERGEVERSGLRNTIRDQFRQMAEELNLATKEDMLKLEQRLDNLDYRIGNLEKKALDASPATGTVETPFSDIRATNTNE